MPIEQDFYLPIYRILSSNIAEEDKLTKTTEWLFDNHKSIKLAKLRSTFRKAAREDLIHEFIEDVDVAIGDKVRSRSTNRVGEVTGIKSDGETLVVKWNTGGIQQLSKDHILVMKKDKLEELDKSDFANGKSSFPGYNKHTKKDIMLDTTREVKKNSVYDI